MKDLLLQVKQPIYFLSFCYCKIYLILGKNVRQPLVVGSLGSYGAYLHDGSEYTGSYIQNTSIETMNEYHRPKINALIEGGVDLLAFETIPCKAEAEVLVNLLKHEYPNMKAWLSFSCKVCYIYFIQYVCIVILY